jgi:hypothetical protein
VKKSFGWVIGRASPYRLTPRFTAFKSTIRPITDSTIDWFELAGQINHLETCPGWPTRFAGWVGVVKKPCGTDRSLPQRLSDFQSH